MPKVKSALKKARALFRPDFDSSSDSESSDKSEEYAHVPIKNLTIPIELITMDEQQANPLEAISQQMEHLMQAINNITAKQTQYEHLLQNTASTSRAVASDTGSNRTVMGDPFRIPDPIKLLPTFNGNKKQLNWWLETAERTLNGFQTLVSPDTFQIYLTAVSNKIEGHAKDVLCTNGNPTTFDEIKRILKAALGDKQDLSTYNCQLWHNKMDGSVSKHYQRTTQLVHNIKSLAKQNVKYNDHWDAVNEFIDEYCLAAYVSGLQKPYFGFVQAAEPKDIQTAYAFICKFTSNESNRELTLNQQFKKSNSASRTTGQDNQQQQQQHKYGQKRTFDNPHKPRLEQQQKSEAMDIGTVQSRLTLNKHNFNNQETFDEEEKEEEECQDSNFCVLDESDSDT